MAESKYRHLFKKSEDGKYGEERSLVRWIIYTSVVFILIILLFKRDNLFRWIEAAVMVNSQQARIEHLDNEIRKMDDFLNAIESDRDSLEKYARETFFFCEKGEDVYIDE